MCEDWGSAAVTQVWGWLTLTGLTLSDVPVHCKKLFRYSFVCSCIYATEILRNDQSDRIFSLDVLINKSKKNIKWFHNGTSLNHIFLICVGSVLLSGRSDRHWWINWPISKTVFPTGFQDTMVHGPPTHREVWGMVYLSGEPWEWV